MTRSRAFRRWSAAVLLTGVVGIGAAGCVAIPVGYSGYHYPGYPVAGPALVVPGPIIAPGIVISPGPRVIHRRGYSRWRGPGWRG